jgi:hypothetical protein
MSIIDKMIRNRENTFTNGRYVFDDDDPETKYLLATINSNQKKRWKKRHTIPYQVLMVFWNWGIQLTPRPPEQGMGLKLFLDFLWKFCCLHPHSNTRAAALHLYLDTVQSELMPRPPIRKRKVKKQSRK